MLQQVDLMTVLGATFSNLSWTGFTITCTFAFMALLWCVMPLAVFGVKARLDSIEQTNRAQTDALLNELRRLNELVLRMPRTDGRTAGAAVADRPPTVVSRGNFRRAG